MLNLVVYTGRLTADPELRYTKSNIPVTSFRIAVQRDFVRDGEPEADFFDIVAWRNTAEFICQYFNKGKMITVQGSNRNRSWEDKNGQKHTVSELVVERAYFADSKKDNNTVSPEIDPFDDDVSDSHTTGYIVSEDIAF